MKKEDKALLIDSFVEKLNNYPHFYVVDVTALDSQTTSDLRRECFKKNIKLQVVKNTLFIKALERVGNEDFEALKPILKNTTGIMFCEVANEPAKLIKAFAKTHGDMPALKGAYAEESVYIGADQLDTLAAIKSKNELIADVVAMLEGPVNSVLSAIDGGATIHGLLDAIEKKGE
ncbi:MAG: 50S ribosomal protein L10 [Bacteroidaceae bacterium]|jgi:large subunit ribosomal protein L10|nr:50S ribosomal protein L10 [Bacteroidaceae bacterium]MBQ6752109.1 50S ribosomal protein L10 [Bacteroidaceae bacterium]